VRPQVATLVLKKPALTKLELTTLVALQAQQTATTR
jgi:hypothetical protein